MEKKFTMNYTSGEYCDMLLILDQCNNQIGAVARWYAEYYPQTSSECKRN